MTERPCRTTGRERRRQGAPSTPRPGSPAAADSSGAGAWIAGVGALIGGYWLNSRLAARFRRPWRKRGADLLRRAGECGPYLVAVELPALGLAAGRGIAEVGVRGQHRELPECDRDQHRQGCDKSDEGSVLFTSMLQVEPVAQMERHPCGPGLLCDCFSYHLVHAFESAVLARMARKNQGSAVCQPTSSKSIRSDSG